MMLASKYASQNPLGWFASEKLDGWRAFWDGSCLRTRTWRVIEAPDFITASLPKGIALDGELWAGRGGFLTVQSLGLRGDKTDPRWSGVRFMVFDAPSLGEHRLELRHEVARSYCSGDFVRFVESVKIQTVAELWGRFRAVVAEGGEGLVIKRPGSFYDFGRSSAWLKLKPCSVD